MAGTPPVHIGSASDSDNERSYDGADTASETASTSQTVVPKTNSSLDALTTEEQRNVLNVVDRLRQCGLDGILSLPQLVVCGDQSSGKSSVLEAITEIPFPRKENLCTRFATEIVLRRAHVSNIAVRIIPDDKRPSTEQAKLKAWTKTIDDFKALPNVIDDATTAMGLDDTSEGNKRAFAKDVLSIEICGPDRPQLTLVDLPGLVHSENKSQSKRDLEMVSELVQKYIEQPQTIILPIISAKNDYANQIILERARKVDPDGHRTLGIITKPDDLHPGSENEAAFIALAKNEDIFFALGWHILRNRGFKERNDSFVERNLAEASFFARGRWTELSPETLGVESLRVRLSELLFQHIKKDLPRLRDDLDEKYEENKKALENLGQKRSTEDEIKHFLMKLSMAFHNTAKAATEGHYEAPYFGKVDTDLDMGSLRVRRLRAHIQQRNIRFAEQMVTFGHKYKIGQDSVAGPTRTDDFPVEALNKALFAEDEETTTDNKDETTDEEEEIKSDVPGKSSRYLPLQEYKSRQQALDWIKEVLIRTRGTELPGTFNPLLIAELFQQQSQNWTRLAKDHMEDIATLCRNFVHDLLKDICPSDVASRLKSMHVSDALRARSNGAEKELSKLMTDKQRHPVTYNHYFTMTVQKKRNERARKELESSMEKSKKQFRDVHQNYQTIVDPATLQELLEDKLERDMDNHSCSDALDSLQAFYKVALKTFIDNVTIQVIERHIVHDLEAIFSPLTVSSWPAAELIGMASEPAAVQRQREFCEGRRKMFEEGQAVFRDMLRAGGGE